MTAKKCAGVRVSGYWRGWPCNAVGTVEHKGRHYCGPHYAVAVKTPEQFVSASEAHERAEKRRVHICPICGDYKKHKPGCMGALNE